MSAALALIDLAGSIALLLWGLHMVDAACLPSAFAPLSRARARQSGPGFPRRVLR